MLSGFGGAWFGFVCGLVGLSSLGCGGVVSCLFLLRGFVGFDVGCIGCVWVCMLVLVVCWWFVLVVGVCVFLMFGLVFRLIDSVLLRVCVCVLL